jgi:hypothetical protein
MKTGAAGIDAFGIGVGIGVAIAIAIVPLLFDTDPDSDTDTDGWLFTAIFKAVSHAPGAHPSA